MNNFAQQTLSDYLELFLQYIAEAKNASPKTIENYNLRLGRFARFVGEIEPKAITAFMVLNFRMHLKKQDLSMKTINYHIVALTFVSQISPA
jgi:site-specific recombinase XerD